LRLLPYLKSTLAVAVVGVAAYALTLFVPLPHVPVLFLAAVVMSAARWGLGPSLLAAFLSVAAGSYFFYSPIYSFRVANLQDLVDLLMFVIVAALTSRLAAGVRAQALEAKRGQSVVGGLYAFGERLAASATPAELDAAILEHLAPLLGQPIHLLLPDAGGLGVAASQNGAAPPPAEVLAAAAGVMAGHEAALSGWRIAPLPSSQGVEGVVAARESDAGPAQVDADYVKALLVQAALAIERSRLDREIADARVKAQGEALREALINSVSHDLQTPLAAILGSATVLESFGEAGEPGVRRELVTTIREEAERLGSYIGNVLDLTRIRSGQIAPRLELVELSDIINAALRRTEKALAGHVLHVDLPPDLPMLRIDLFLMEHAVMNVLDNAAKYSSAGSKVSIVASEQEGEVVLDITDCGCGVPAEDLDRVFDAFYRGGRHTAGAAAGSGLGLAICRAFVAANGGSAIMISDGVARGATVRLRLPVPASAEALEGASADD
jgi:two-component system, OmpR family, sensor histidine kinase KdpD